jgi:hypothetical protein
MPRKSTKTAPEPSKAPDQGVDTTQAAKEPQKRKVGRPSSFSQEVADYICTELGKGRSLRKILLEDGMPSYQTVYSWLAAQPQFLDQYTRAREEQAETLADEIVDIADETPEMNPIVDRNGELIRIEMHSAYLQWQKQRIEARKWTAAKLRPKKYGDRVTMAGDAENPLKVEADVTIFDALIQNLEAKRQTKSHG